MRIVKTNSASNSPRASIGLGRRRTVMTDRPCRRRLAMADQAAIASGGMDSSNDSLPVPARSIRPVSWHPSSHLAPQPTYQSTYPVPRLGINNEYHIFELPPTPAVYSGYTSPASTFSPLSAPFTGYDQQQFPYSDASTLYPLVSSYTPYQPSSLGQQTPNYLTPSTGNMDPSMYSHFDWGQFTTHGFESSTAPPTPDNFLPIQHPDPSFPPDDAIPYHSLSDPESAGEELIGMGLYDSPESTKVPSSDLQLDNYRALMMSQLLGSTYRKHEPTGKGLKLEETWNPPASDDEEDDDDEDGEGEDEGDISGGGIASIGEQVSNILVSNDSAVYSNHGLDANNFLPDVTQANYPAGTYDHNGWL
jgi:hypothetical protein